jgi:hypothetical protein
MSTSKINLLKRIPDNLAAVIGISISEFVV